ncbi:MAG: hypothetical protein AAGK97_08465, partial [Bacteroidota bacterium]
MITFEDIVSSYKNKPTFKTINYLKSVILENKRDCTFEKVTLPFQAQLSIVNKIISIDLNKDKLNDLILLTNHESVEIHNGQIDGLNGLVLLNKGDMKFEALATSASGFSINESA